MSILKAIELIRRELPQQVLDELAHLTPVLVSRTDIITFKGFSFCHINDPNNFKRIIESRLKASQGHSIKGWLERELNFLNDSFNNSTEDQLWSGYSLVDSTYVSYLVDVGRQGWLKNIDRNYNPSF